MHARDQSSIFSTGGKFRPDYGLLLELHALTLVTRSKWLQVLHHLYVCICRTLPLFVWHRQNWNVVYPNVDLEQEELEDLSIHGTYIAGFTDASVEGRTELYDVFINGWPVAH